MNSKYSDTDEKTATAVLVDAHVHIHDCFDLGSVLTAAAQNFATAASDLSLEGRYAPFLCLTETSSARKFSELRIAAENRSGTSTANNDGWQIHPNEEVESVCATHPEHGNLQIVSGKQIVVAERLEVLALGCVSDWRDGLPASEVIESLAAEDMVAVLPWGFGKWLGQRGRILRSLLEKHRSRFLFLGDNSGRPVFFSEPREFALAREMDLKVLPGTDPLPFASESHRAGSFGFRANIAVADKKPWDGLRRQLIRPEVVVTPFGRLESPLRFVINQVSMQYAMRKNRGAA